MTNESGGSASHPESPAFAAAAASFAQQEKQRLATVPLAASIDRLTAARAADIDQLCLAAWQPCAAAGLALFAIGGYGRRELFPYSDIDLLVLTPPGHAPLDPALLIERFAAALWSACVPRLAVRSPDDCEEQAQADLATATAMFEARPLAADATLIETLADALSASRVWPAADYLTAKLAELATRHHRFNDTAFNLEPNLKDGPGGLRDIQTLGWLANRLFGVAALGDLVDLGVIGADEYATLERARREIACLREGLHRVAGRAEERLLFDYQRELATLFGITDAPGDAANGAVELLMQRWYRNAALVLRLSGRLLQRFEEQVHGAPRSIPIAEGYVLRGRWLSRSCPPEQAAMDVSARRSDFGIFELFGVWSDQDKDIGLHSETARWLGERLDRINQGFRADPANKARFVALLRGPEPALTLARMARLGVLGRYLPVFGAVSGRMQFDLFHCWTVDQHTLQVLANVAGIADGSMAARFGELQPLHASLRAPELLLIAALFHDIAKGRGGDHAVLGGGDVESFTKAHGFGRPDIALVKWLVEAHLLMSVTAQRRDISDPDVIREFAGAVGSRERLDYLYLLTIADIAGTSPKLWNAWKARLLADLHAATRFALRRSVEQDFFAAERAEAVRETATGLLAAQGFSFTDIESIWADFPAESFLRYRAEQIAWQTAAVAGFRGRAATSATDPMAVGVAVRPIAGAGRAFEVFVWCDDQDGLFAEVAVTLDRCEFDIVAARIVSAPSGMSLDTIQVIDRGDTGHSDERARGLVEQLEANLRQRPFRTAPARRLMPRQLRHFPVPVRMDFEQRAAPPATRLTLVCGDQPGLLGRVAAVFRDQGIRVHDARIATFGERVEDFFVLTDSRNGALDETAITRLEAALQGELAPGPRLAH